MSNFVDLKYIQQLGTRLQKFHKQSEHTYAFRCPVCGDSKKNKNKTRGYIYPKNDSYIFHCHNCGDTKSLGNLIQFMDEGLYAEYRLERFSNKDNKLPELTLPKTKKFKVYDVGVLKELTSFDDIDDSLPQKQYIIQRQIPKDHWHHLFYCDDFPAFVNKLLPGKIKNGRSEPRLIIPFFNEDKKMFAFSGRSFGRSSLRYVNIMLDENEPKIFGIERWKKNETTIVVEGPLDSLFLNNCIASSGGDLVSSIHSFPKDNFIIAYDNEPRNTTTINKVRKSIEMGYKTLIWPNNIKEKDINAMVLAGKNPLDIQNMICDNAKSGLQAKVALAFWR